MQRVRTLVLCITGASGAPYAEKFLNTAVESGLKLHCVVSTNGKVVLEEELGVDYDRFREFYAAKGVVFHDEFNFRSPLASGSFLKKNVDAVVVLPCSVGTLGAVANGVVLNLIHRVCDAAIKERVPLVMAVREMPMSAVHLENMLKLQRAGATAFPLSPAFYHKPKKLEDLVSFAVGKIFDLLGVEVNLFNRWGEGEGQ
jgi:4-hydroxy-3-polyprenylbenzoate decarboxylase